MEYMILQYYEISGKIKFWFEIGSISVFLDTCIFAPMLKNPSWQSKLRNVNFFNILHTLHFTPVMLMVRRMDDNSERQRTVCMKKCLRVVYYY